VAYRKIESRRDFCVDEVQHVDDGVAIYGAATHDDVRQMQRRAQELNAFSTIHISEIHVEASYSGPKRYLPDFDHLQLQLRELTYIDKVRTTEQLVFFTISLAFFSPPMIMNFCPWDRILRSLLNPIWISLS
jgi:hypothetical protein